MDMAADASLHVRTSDFELLILLLLYLLCLMCQLPKGEAPRNMDADAQQDLWAL